MFHAINAKTADDLWCTAASWLLKPSVAWVHHGRGGDTKEVLNVAMTLQNPRQRWISSRSPAMNPAFAIAEVIWMLNGRNDSEMLNYFNPSLPKFAGKGDFYQGAYGHRLRSHHGLDQLKRAYEVLKANPSSRQVVLQIWDVETDFPGIDGKPASDDIPCNVNSLLKVRNGRLEWTQIMRSNDLFRGLPHNIVQFTSLQEIMAGWLELDIGHYNHYSDSLHVYESDQNLLLKRSESRLPLNYDSLALSPHSCDRVMSGLASFCDFLISDKTKSIDIESALKKLSIPQSFFNLALILAADATRRRKDFVRMIEIVNQCSNDCLKVMFSKWSGRVSAMKE